MYNESRGLLLLAKFVVIVEIRVEGSRRLIRHAQCLYDVSQCRCYCPAIVVVVVLDVVSLAKA